MRRAGADGFLSRLLGGRKTNSENPQVGEEDGDQRQQDGEDGTEQAVNVVDRGVRAG